MLLFISYINYNFVPCSSNAIDGFDITGPGGKYKNDEAGKPFLKSLDEAESALRNRLDVPNAWVERKRFAIALHYRQVESDQLPRLKRIFKAVASNYDELKTSGGKKVLELRPNVDWDKGKALLHFLENMYADSSRIVPVYIGDDVTDEDAFRAIKNRGLPIVVGKGNRKTLASFSLRDPEEVRKLMEALITEAEKAITENIWIMGYDSFAPEEEKHREALCTLGNGYFATRGAAPESAADGVHYPGTYKAGCYNRLQTEIQGHNLENESLVNLPNWLPLNFRIEDGEWFDITKVNIKEYRQEINLKQGTLSRMIRFIDGKDRDTRVFQRRFVSMSDPHLAGLEVTVSAENWSGNITIRSAIDGSVTNSGVERYRDLNNKHLKPVESQLIDNETIFLQMETNQSHIRIAETARTRIYQNSRKMELSYNLIKKPEYIAQEFSLRLEERKSVTVEKIVSLYTSKDNAISESGIESRKEISRAAGFDGLLERHILSWNHLWERGQILMRNGERVSLIVNLHIFHLFQTVSPHSIDHDFGVPPRGLHGEAYRGHILWDELFIFPFLNFRIPDITRALLMYRYRRLPEARWAARQQGYEGAMYPWQSGSDGQEESQELHLNPRSGRWIPDNSQLQRHINIAIAYNIWMYYQITGNINFLYFYGTEMLVEIARFWASIARYNRAIDRYEILGVMGPDEFHDAYPDSDKPGIDNNSYTNIMVVWTFCRTLEALELLPAHRREALNDKLRIRKEELEHWDDISRKMRVAFHEDGIISQFEDYDKLKEFHWKDYQEKYGNIHRLDRILESEGDTPNRYKLSKQADVLMIFYLLSADELYEIFRRLKYPFESEYIPRNIEYYLKRTSHGSTLSRVVHAWVMARSRRELSWHLFKEALESDVSDIQGGTTSEGIHLGAMAGTVDLVQRCYTGIEARQDRLNLNPYIPKDLKEINFSILYRQHHLYLEIKPGRMTLSAEKYGDEPVSIGFKEKVYQLLPGDTIHFKLGGHKKQ